MVFHSIAITFVIVLNNLNEFLRMMCLPDISSAIFTSWEGGGKVQLMYQSCFKRITTKSIANNQSLSFLFLFFFDTACSVPCFKQSVPRLFAILVPTDICKGLVQLLCSVNHPSIWKAQKILSTDYSMGNVTPQGTVPHKDHLKGCQ